MQEKLTTQIQAEHPAPAHLVINLGRAGGKWRFYTPFSPTFVDKPTDKYKNPVWAKWAIEHLSSGRAVVQLYQKGGTGASSGGDFLTAAIGRDEFACIVAPGGI